MKRKLRRENLKRKGGKDGNKRKTGPKRKDDKFLDKIRRKKLGKSRKKEENIYTKIMRKKGKEKKNENEKR